MNVLVVQIDSLSRHFLACYGNDWVETPTLTAFARDAVLFDRHYTGSLPCMPARREIWAGVEELWWRPWGALEPWDVTIARRARAAGYTTALVTDHYHFFEQASHGYPYEFDGWELVRGHEYDAWRTQPLREVPAWARLMLERRPETVQYVRNVDGFEREDDFFAAKVMTAAARRLRELRGTRFYLHVDSFDVHEPFHVPEPYRTMYTDDTRDLDPWPAYGRADTLGGEELAWLRAQFAGKLTMVDRWLARLLEEVDHDTTAVVVTTDHGHYLGEHGWLGKPRAPLYDTLCRIPLLIRAPGVAPARVGGLTQTVDVHATVLDLLGIGEHGPHSRSLVPLLHEPRRAHRDVAVYGYFSERVGITDGEWTLLRDHDVRIDRGPTYGVNIRPAPTPESLTCGDHVPGAGMPTWRLVHRRTGPLPDPYPDLLFADEAQEHDLAAARPEVVDRLAARLGEHARQLGAPPEPLRRLRL